MSISEVRRVFGSQCPSTKRIKVVIGELKDMRKTGAVLKRLMEVMTLPEHVRFNDDSRQTLRQMIRPPRTHHS